MNHETGQIQKEVGTQAVASSSRGPETSRAVVTNGGLNPFNYDFIEAIAVVAIYENLQSTPKIIQIPGGKTHQFIEDIAGTTDREAKNLGGQIPYTIIREVAENFIHANFREPVVSIFDKGNTIRFADQGPGITNKDQVQKPGFTSATEPMKKYIRGVGSGLPIVKDYLTLSHGTIKIEDNINQGAVITISLLRDLEDKAALKADKIPSLTENDKVILRALLPNEALGITEMNHKTQIPNATIHKVFAKLEAVNLIESINKKRQLTEKGIQIALSL